MPYNKVVERGQWIGDLPLASEPPTVGRWIAAPRKRRWMVPAALFSIVLPQIANWINIAVNGGRHLPFLRILVLSLLGAFILVALCVLLRERLLRRATKEDVALIDGAFGDQFPAEIAIIVGKKGLGTDRGVVWFSDGLMGFSGRASSFVLAAWDVRLQTKAVAASLDQAAIPAGSLKLVDAPEPSFVTLTPLGGHRAEYRKRFEQFEAETAALDAERHWPPLEPYEATKTLGEPA